MNDFIFPDRWTSVAGLCVALGLVVIGGCAAVAERDFADEIGSPILDPVATGARRHGPRCPLRHTYVCEREVGAVACSCVPEPVRLPPGPDGLRRAF